jgi:hypothetical protein
VEIKNVSFFFCLIWCREMLKKIYPKADILINYLQSDSADLKVHFIAHSCSYSLLFSSLLFSPLSSFPYDQNKFSLLSNRRETNFFERMEMLNYLSFCLYDRLQRSHFWMLSSSPKDTTVLKRLKLITFSWKRKIWNVLWRYPNTHQQKGVKGKSDIN